MEEYILNKCWGVDNFLFQKVRELVLKHIRNEMLITVNLSSCPYNGNKQRIFVSDFNNDDRENCYEVFDAAVDMDIVAYRFDDNKIVYALLDEVEALAGF